MGFDQFLAGQVVMQGFDRVEIEVTLRAAKRLKVSRRRRRRRFAPRMLVMMRMGMLLVRRIMMAMQVRLPWQMGIFSLQVTTLTDYQEQSMMTE